MNQRSRPKTLVVTTETVYVLTDLSTGLHRKLWTCAGGSLYQGMSMIGTCNGLICLCDDRMKPPGAIILASKPRHRRDAATPAAALRGWEAGELVATVQLYVQPGDGGVQSRARIIRL